jgi:hypothetical protein
MVAPAGLPSARAQDTTGFRGRIEPRGRRPPSLVQAAQGPHSAARAAPPGELPQPVDPVEDRRVRRHQTDERCSNFLIGFVK